MLDVAKISAITLDLDDTLWPIWPTIERAERVLHQWLSDHAPMTAALFASPQALREIRNEMAALRPDLHHDLSAMRRESIRMALARAQEDPAPGVQDVMDDDALLAVKAAKSDKDTLVVKTSMGGEQRINTARYKKTGRGGKGHEVISRGAFTEVVLETPPPPPPLTSVN